MSCKVMIDDDNDDDDDDNDDSSFTFFHFSSFKIVRLYINSG
jgi:hypothetical protein